MELKTLKNLRGFWMPNQVKAKKYRMVKESELKQEAINWIKELRSMTYAQKYCLNCMKIYGGGNGGQQYCCRGPDDKLHFLEQQTGSSLGAISVLMKFHNITEEDFE